MSLKTDYKDYIPATTLRKYQQITNSDGTISLQDVTDYTQVGDKAGAGVLNGIGTEVNGHILNLDAHVATYIHTKSGTVHNLAGAGKNIEFLPTAGIADGDTWTVNNIAVTATLQNGEPLPADLFKSGSWVTGVRLDGAKLNFKGGAGSIKDMYDFPLSIQTAAPTPVNTNHIWVSSADSYDAIIMDEAMRADYADRTLLFKTDSTDNISQYLLSQKKTTAGVKINIVNQKIGRDSNPWHNALNNYFFGTTNYLDQWAKWPTIYSKKNGGIIDVETAKRWDGSAWQYLSQKGSYLAVGVEQEFRIYNRNGISLIRHADIVSSQHRGSEVLWAPNQNYVVEDLFYYTRSGDGFVQHVLPAPYPSANVTRMAISPDSMYLALITYIGATYYLDVYKMQTDNTFVWLTTITYSSSTTLAPQACEWIDSATLMYSAQDNVAIIARSGDTFSTLVALGNMFGWTSAGIYNMRRTPNGNLFIARNGLLYFAVKNSRTSYVIAGGGPFTFGSAAWEDAMVPYDDTHVVYANGTTLSFAGWNGSAFVLINSFSTGNLVYALALSPDRNYVFMGDQYNNVKVFGISASGLNSTLLATYAVGKVTSDRVFSLSVI